MDCFNYDNIDHNEMLEYFNNHKKVSIVIPRKHLIACKSFLFVNTFYKSGINKKYGLIKIPFMFIWGVINGLWVSAFHTKIMFISPFLQLANFSKYDIQIIDNQQFVLEFTHA